MKIIPQVIVALVAGASLFAAPAALAVTPEPTPAPTPSLEPWSYAEYTGTYSGTYYDAEGVTQQSFSQEQPVQVRCTDDGCVLYGLTLGREYEFPLEGASGEWERPNTGSLCTDDFVAGGTLTVEANAATMTATLEQNASGHVNCDSGEIQQFGTHGTFVGAFTAGNPCVLEGAPCPPEAATPTADPVAISAPGAREPRLPATPSILSTLATPAQTLAPTQVLLAVALTIVLVILMALPTHLLNGAVEQGSDRVAALLQRVRRPRAVTPKGRYPGLLPAATGVLVAGIISCFIDPAFGFDVASIRTLASVLLSFAIDVGLGWLAVILLVRRVKPDATASFRFAPATLLVVVATVLFTRVTGFEPGIVFGLVAGVTFGAVLATADKARVALAGLGWAFVVAILAWIGYALLGGIADPGAVLVFVRETLASTAIAGIAALPIALIPLRGLTGHEVWAWNRGV